MRSLVANIGAEVVRPGLQGFGPFLRPLVALTLIGLGLTGCASHSQAAARPPGPDSPGRRLYVAKCAKCHKFYDPAKYSDDEWRMWMNKMSKKAKLKPDQAQAISQYVDEFLRNPGRR